MNDIQFQTDDADEFAPRASAARSPSFSDRLIAWGIAKNQQQALYILIGFAIAVLILAYFIYSSLTASPAPPPEPLVG